MLCLSLLHSFSIRNRGRSQSKDFASLGTHFSSKDSSHLEVVGLLLKGNRSLKFTTEFLLKLHTVVECYMVLYGE